MEYDIVDLPSRGAQVGLFLIIEGFILVDKWKDRSFTRPSNNFSISVQWSPEFVYF